MKLLKDVFKFHNDIFSVSYYVAITTSSAVIMFSNVFLKMNKKKKNEKSLSDEGQTERKVIINI